MGLEFRRVLVRSRVINKGRIKDANALNKLPDIDRQLFEYLFKRLKMIEDSIDSSEDEEFKNERDELNILYESFLKSLKN